MRLLNTPCIGICSTVYGDDVCRGCKRFAREIIDWNTYETTQQQHVFDRLNDQLTPIVANYLTIVDKDLLRQRMIRHHVRYREEQSPYVWLYDLLRVGAERITTPDNYGFRVREAYQQYLLPPLFAWMNEAFYAVAQRAFDEADKR